MSVSYRSTVDEVTVVRFRGSLNSAVMTGFSGTPAVPYGGLIVSTAGEVTSVSLTTKPPSTVCTLLPVVMTTSRGPSVAVRSMVMSVVSDVAELTWLELTVMPGP